MRYMTVDRAQHGRESLLLRGTLDMCVLALLRTPNHAYGVVQALRAAGFTQISYGTVYPLVSRVRQQGLVSQESLPGDGGPSKNVLTLTKAGHEALATWQTQWDDHHRRVSGLLAQEEPQATHERPAHV
jgi:PadR family transcriptional regulator, regulatory protein PadR